jgi:hypothetical protein
VSLLPLSFPPQPASASVANSTPTSFFIVLLSGRPY